MPIDIYPDELFVVCTKLVVKLVRVGRSLRIIVEDEQTAMLLRNTWDAESATSTVNTSIPNPTTN